MNDPSPEGIYDFAVTRLNADGSPDTSFSGDGRTTVDIGGFYDAGHAIALDGNGRIVVAGYSDSGGSSFALIRLRSDGGLDAAFHAITASTPRKHKSRL